MAKKYAKASISRVYFFCPHCRLTLPAVWTAVSGLRKNIGADDEQKARESDYCENCGKKFHYPPKYLGG